MRTNIETKTNIDSWLETSALESTRQWFKDSFRDVLSNNRTGLERLKISNQTLSELSSLANNTHILVEWELAKIFWISWEKARKLKEDFREPITLTSVLSQAEELWSSSYA